MQPQSSNCAKENRRRELEAQIKAAREELAEMSIEYTDKSNKDSNVVNNIFEKNFNSFKKRKISKDKYTEYKPLI